MGNKSSSSRQPSGEDFVCLDEEEDEKEESSLDDDNDDHCSHSDELPWGTEPWGKIGDLNPSRGDIIKVRYGTVQHAMTYLGVGEDGITPYVLHFRPLTPSSSSSCPDSSKTDQERDYTLEHRELAKCVREWKKGYGDGTDRPGCIEWSKLTEVVGPHDPCKVDNMEWLARFFGVHERREDDAILEKACDIYFRRKDNPPPYNIAKFNCETFSLRLRYGKDIPSEQTAAIQNNGLSLAGTRLAGNLSRHGSSRSLNSVSGNGGGGNGGSGLHAFLPSFLDKEPSLDLFYPGPQYDL